MTANESVGLGRRDLFRVGAGAAAVAVASGTASTAYAQEEFDYDGWFDDVPNFEGTVDRTGDDEVTIDVGAGDDGLLFEPPAVHVDPGTTVVFEWTGEGGAHNVEERETGERYVSDTVEPAGTTYEVTFESDGISTYVCAPHAGVGMKGAVAVGDGDGAPDVTEGEFSEGSPDEEGDEDEELPPAAEVERTYLAMYGIAAVLGLLSPAAVVVLMRREQDREESE